MSPNLLVRIVTTYFKLFVKIYIWNKSESNKLIAELNGNLETITFDKETATRIKAYTTQSALTNSWFSTLRGTPTSSLEQKAALYTGAITPLLDDLTDVSKEPSAEIWKNISNKDVQHSIHEFPTIVYLNKKLHTLCNDHFHGVFREVLIAQDTSIKQIKNDPLTTDELIQITKHKGGKATLLYRLILDNHLVKGEEIACLILGFLLQIINDAFDIFKDHQDRQQTLLTKTNDISSIYQLFLKNEHDFLLHWSGLPYKKSNILKSLIEISTILSRGHVCFNQLIKLQEESKGNFELNKFSRSQLICDMEKPINIWRSLQYSRQILSKFSEFR
ncbi:MAG: class 1 isoprenoid biosynthesis enzyme [Reichenbachiella sp.]